MGLTESNPSKHPEGRSHAGKGARGDVSMAGPVASAEAEPRLSDSYPSSTPLIESTDAQRWAREFMALFGDRLGDVDEALMLTWFANAIEAGRRAGREETP